MPQPIVHARKWLLGILLLLVAAVTVAYWVTRSRVGPVLHNVSGQLGLDIQQTSDGFSLSKSEGGRTLFTIRASKAVQFKAGGHADLRNVHIVVYGHAHDRYDQIYGNQFTYDPQSGDINAVSEVHIDLQGNIEGPQKPDQAPPDELKNPIHLLTHSLTFNQKTGIAHTDEVEFRTTQANGSAKGAYYDSNSNQLLLKSDVHIVTTGQHPAVITGSSASLQKTPRQVTLENARLEQPERTLTADKGTMLFEADNSVKHVVMEGNVHIQSRGPSVVDIMGPRGDVNMGPNNAVQQTILSGGASFVSHGASLAHGSADNFVLDFDDQNQPLRLHLVKNARMIQDPKPAGSGAGGQASGQPMEIAADQLDFLLADGNQLKAGDTSGKASITIFPAPGSEKQKVASNGEKETGKNSTTVATAGKFHATFDANNRIQSLHGAPNSRIVSSSPGDPDKVSVAHNLDVAFAPDGGVQKLIQTGDFQYHEASAKPDTGGREAFADVATYTPADSMLLLLVGSPRIIDGGMTTTATNIRINRQTGDGFADDNVKTTYSDLKPQPDGALLASSDPVHVTAQHMTAHKEQGVAHYTGNVRLWQTANVVRAPKIDFDNQKRSIVAESDPSQKVMSLFMQNGQGGKLTPVDVTSDRLSYLDEERRARFTGDVFAKSAPNTVNAQLIDVFLKPADPDAKDSASAPANARKKPAMPGSEGPSQIDHMVGIGKVVVTGPNRRAVGDRLVYTADDGKYVLTGKSPSIFDAERGTVWGDSLTFYSRDDRVLVESKRSSPTITRARTTK